MADILPCTGEPIPQQILAYPFFPITPTDAQATTLPARWLGNSWLGSLLLLLLLLMLLAAVALTGIFRMLGSDAVAVAVGCA